MSAGESARSEAEKSARAADNYERKAKNARQRADAFSKGGAGEQYLAEVLAPLGSSGWFFLHDRVNPLGGNIDTIAIGPGGVIVMDAKAWNGKLVATEHSLKVGGWSKLDQIAKVKEQAGAVQHAVENEVEVSCGLIFTAQPWFDPDRVTDVTVAGTDHLVQGLQDMPAVLSAAAVERLLRSISEAFPPAGTAPSAASGLLTAESEEATKHFERCNRLMYITAWRGGGKSRLYLKSDAGLQLGYRDVIAGTVHLEPDADHPFAHTILAASTPGGLVLDRTALPKVKVEMPAGRLLGVLGKLWASALVGQVSNARGVQRMYCTLANPTEGVFNLGYVELKTGWIKPAIAGNLSEGLGPADKYLVQLRDRLPSAK